MQANTVSAEAHPQPAPNFFFKNVNYLQDSAKHNDMVGVLSLPNVYMLRVSKQAGTKGGGRIFSNKIERFLSHKSMTLRRVLESPDSLSSFLLPGS